MTANAMSLAIFASAILSSHLCERSKGSDNLSDNNAGKSKTINFC